MIKFFIYGLIQSAVCGTIAHADISAFIKEDFERTEQKLHLPCFNVPVWQDKSDVYFEVKNSKNRDVCRQNVISSPEKIIVKTKCYRNDSYELMNNVIEFRNSNLAQTVNRAQ
jgi:hypothetical protein